MSRLFNLSAQTERRRELRKSLAPAEALLWTRLRNKQVHGYKFRRQYGIGSYVVDFYCPELKLALEIDGRSHLGEEAADRDLARQAWIEQFGIHFLRFSDTEVLRSIDAVVEYVGMTCQEVAAGGCPTPPSE